MIFALLFQRSRAQGRRTSKFGSPRRGKARCAGRLRVWPIVALIVGVGVVSGGYGVWRRVRPLLDRRPEYQVKLEEFWITTPPAWVKHDLMKDVRQRAELPATLSLLESDLPGRLATAFANHPWVARVGQVRIGGGGRVEIHLQYRRAVAMVQTPGSLLPVDVEGTLLPAEDISPEESEVLPVIRGVQSSPLCPVGACWDDPLVVGGAKIAEALAEHWVALNLQALEAAFWNVASAESSGDAAEGSPNSKATDESVGTFYLLSRGGSRIVWGRPPGTDHPGEIPPSEKISRLQKYIDDYGSLESPAGPYELDIRHWKDLSRRRRVITSAALQ